MAVLTAFNLKAQQDKIVSVGIGLNRYGFMADMKIHGADKNEQKKPFDFYIELGNIQHPREVALVNNTLQSSGVYKFGKINYAWVLRPYAMTRKNFSKRQDKKNIALNLVYGAGIPINYYWPVYIMYFEANAGANAPYTEERYDPKIHSQARIGGRAPFTRGIKQGSVLPGFGLNGGLEFIWGNYRSDVKILTIGARTETFLHPIPILYLNNQNKQVFTTFYFNFAFGFGKS